MTEHTARLMAFFNEDIDTWEYLVADGATTTNKYLTRASAWAAWHSGKTESLASARDRENEASADTPSASGGD